ncbi:MAG TPA: dienelactone hydrolase family protein [Oligoflexus sp.]|uniref:dienelactone hydrolase family protein n=1 Tax=Oligoflexus sp. TaxID=1971216 RepID=UPI002D2A6D2A|nr:dienelactone hydrolase family protein [Oligoflexus sp.]HYX34578.1 dienelactone hydrolase family protein [Oligoflexus sp.]
MQRFIFLLLCSFMMPWVAAGEEGKPVPYKVGALKMEGLYLKPTKPISPARGVLVLHEWYGINDHTLQFSKWLQEAGYHVFVADLFGKTKRTKHPKEAESFVKERMAQPEQSHAIFQKALEVLQTEAKLKIAQIAGVGFCFGGSSLIDALRRGVQLPAVATFHANPATPFPIRLQEQKGRLLFVAGADDPFIPKAAVQQLIDESFAAKLRLELHLLPRVKHSFTVAGATQMGHEHHLPFEYSPEATAEAKVLLLDFLGRSFQ